eukprot:CAMPEP_0113470970 /NCGR_PEP_ID=MMETSP0014_2-20120614/16731_1 /TAXON_ID=2857 /ORGANISM="Nitzschia sp." /LENGTH=312 /DNA_ID=CAMNT_0000363579 /DNA_START=345 /DNA_END=1283 /DNA_ORIENTATION=- /assembly_acc=CAM_ASM_000159
MCNHKTTQPSSSTTRNEEEVQSPIPSSVPNEIYVTLTDNAIAIISNHCNDGHDKHDDGDDNEEEDSSTVETTINDVFCDDTDDEEIELSFNPYRFEASSPSTTRANVIDVDAEDHKIQKRRSITHPLLSAWKYKTGVPRSSYHSIDDHEEINDTVMKPRRSVTSIPSLTSYTSFSSDVMSSMGSMASMDRPPVLPARRSQVIPVLRLSLPPVARMQLGILFIPLRRQRQLLRLSLVLTLSVEQVHHGSSPVAEGSVVMPIPVPIPIPTPVTSHPNFPPEESTVSTSVDTALPPRSHNVHISCSLTTNYYYYF